MIEDEVEIVVKYGDLLKVAFPKKHKTEKVIVIAVNRCFDTVISEDLVKADSVHDQLFFLLALTTFDENCVAHCTKYEFLDCIFKLYEYYDAHGQGNELYLYPMGTKMARTGRSCLFLFFFCNNSRLDIVTKSGYNDNRIEIMIHDVVTGGKYGNFI